MKLSFEYHFHGPYPKGKTKWAIELREEIDDLRYAFESEFSLCYASLVDEIIECGGRIEVHLNNESNQIDKCIPCNFSADLIGKIKLLHESADWKCRKWIKISD